MTIKALVLEDDDSQRRHLHEMLERELSFRVQSKSSESEFRSEFELIAADPPDVAILDVMVKWTSPSRQIRVAPDDAKTTENAGLRCAKMLRDDPRTQNVRVILYSVLPQEDSWPDSPLADGVEWIVKDSDFGNLVEAIRTSIKSKF